MPEKRNGFSTIELMVVILFFSILTILSHLAVKHIRSSKLNSVIEEIKEYSSIEFLDQNINIVSKFNPNAFWSIKTTEDGKKNLLTIGRKDKFGLFTRDELLSILEKVVGYEFIIISNDREISIDSVENSDDKSRKYYFGIVID